MQDTCATLLTLYLLDSRSVTETLSVLLAQRSKIFYTALGNHPETLSPAELHHVDSNNPANGHLPDLKGGAKSPKRRIREVRQSTEVALDIISRTIKAAREIFGTVPPSHHSMITGVLEYIQSDTPHSTAESALPTELLLTTQTLLTALPSSTHFLLLPPDLRSYKPYVDLSTSSSSLPPQRFAQLLDEWFQQASKKLQHVMETWFSDLESVQEVWSVRMGIRKWVVTTSKLEAHEQTHLKVLLDDLSRQRMVAIWQAVLAAAANEFQHKLVSSLSKLVKGSDANAIGAERVKISKPIILIMLTVRFLAL